MAENIGEQLLTSVVTVITAIIGIAFLAVLVSKSAATAQVITAGGSALSSVLKTALSPVSGGALSSSNLLGDINITG